MNFKICPEKRPNCPASQKCRTKAKASCVPPQATLIFSEYLDLPSVTALHAFESCIYIFSSFYMTTCFLLHHPRCSEFCHRFKKLLYKIKEQGIREEEWEKKTAACEAPSLIFKLIYNYVQHCTYTVNGDINTLR